MGVGIQVKNLNAWFGKKQALYDINMTALANHCTAVIGPSGCGKSTFVRCINRMHETMPDARAAGRVMIGEVDAYNGTSSTQLRRRVGMVFQKPNPFPTMSIYDNVASGLKLNGFIVIDRHRGKWIRFLKDHPHPAAKLRRRCAVIYADIPDADRALNAGFRNSLVHAIQAAD